MKSGSGIAWLALAICLLLSWPLPVCAKEITVGGSGSCMAIVEVLGKEFKRRHPGITVSIPNSLGSVGGLRAAAEGAIDIGMISRPLKAEEELLKLDYRRFARAVVVLAVHPDVTDSNITGQELLEIYQGSRSRWKNGRPIVVLTREPQDSSIMALRNNINGFSKVYEQSWRNKLWTTLFTYQSMHHYLEKTPDALGISDLGSIAIEKLKVKPLNYEGVKPCVSNVRKGSYPLVLPYAFVYRAKNLTPEAKSFLEFVFSAQGRKILSKYDYVPE